MNYIIHPEKTTDVRQLGGKAGVLAALHQANFLIPGWFALSTAAFQANLTAVQRRKLAQHDAGQPLPLEDILDDIQLNRDIEAALAQALDRLCPEAEPVAVRSSAPDEDGQRHSFAGQLQTFLDVPHHQVAARVVDVWRSGYSRSALAYRREHGLNPQPQPPAVIIQRMVKADVSGVAFSVDPVSGRRNIAVVAAIRGPGVALVSGEVDADTYRLDRQGRIIDRQLAAGPAISGNGINKIETSAISGPLQAATVATEGLEQLAQPVLTDAQIQAVANLARQVEQFFGCPQDIEWAFEGEQLYLLQARPITTLSDESRTAEVFARPGRARETSAVSQPAPPDGCLNLWDNSNIAESYPGVTTPLTFSFARRAYEEVYRQFCRLMGVPAGTIAGQASTFRRMLGLMQGRIYYNLLSWYRVLALLPGYKLNRRFMEQMMGVKEPLPDELAAQQTPPGRADRLRDGLYLLRTLIGLILNFLLLPRRVAAFYQRLNAALGPGRPDLSRRRPDELVAYYRDLEEQLLSRWDAPLINDFFAMIFYGVLRKLTEKWCGDAHGTLQNQLLSQTGDIISAEPARRIRDMAQLAAIDPAFTALLCAGSLPEILARLPEQPEFLSSYQAYLDKFGDRCLEELKLESSTLHDDPLLLLRSAGQLAAQIKASPSEKATEPLNKPESDNHSSIADPQRPTSPSFQAQQRVDQTLARRPLRRLLFNWVLKNARRLIRNRENLRFERTRLFGRARMIFLELGRRYHALGLLTDPRDIFYLEVEEALGLVDSVTVTTNLKALVALRQTEFEAYRRQSPPPNRFETRGIPHHNFNPSFQRTETEPDNKNPKSKIANLKSLQGLGCSPGIVIGPVRIVTDPKTAVLQPGDILVALRTDPGWILLFPSASGLLVEHGSLLSHSAIVSRELGLPAIVSLPGLTGWLKDGDWVEFDGSTGIVTKL